MPGKTAPLGPEQQRKALEQSERKAHAKQPRNFKDDAMTDKQVRVEPDGTGPTSTGTFDTEEDRDRGSGNDTHGSGSDTQGAGKQQGAAAQGSARRGRPKKR